MADQMTDRPADARARLLEHFAEGTLDQGERWAKLWDKGDFLPWDRGLPNPALVDLLSDREDLIGSSIEDNEQPSRRRKKVLVPGCGKGYDVLLFASFGYDAYGLEISESAVKACKKEQETNGHKYPIRNPSIGGGRADFVKGDFFGHDWIDAIQGEAVFDIIYDYTFLSALPPSLRPPWSLRMSRLLRPSPYGKLVCIEFPTYKDPLTGGPPYALPPEVYLAHLNRPGKEVPYDDNGHVQQTTVEQLAPGAFKRIAHWQPARTHDIGKGTDWISLWQHT